MRAAHRRMAQTGAPGALHPRLRSAPEFSDLKRLPVNASFPPTGGLDCDCTFPSGRGPGRETAPGRPVATTTRNCTQADPGREVPEAIPVPLSQALRSGTGMQALPAFASVPPEVMPGLAAASQSANDRPTCTWGVNGWTEMDWDFVIVGSGFGGSVCALRLVEKGYRVLLLEKGRRLAADDFPHSNWNLKRWLWLPTLGFRGLFKMTFL